jgi:hypothetical protein
VKSSSFVARKKFGNDKKFEQNKKKRAELRQTCTVPEYVEIYRKIATYCTVVGHEKCGPRTNGIGVRNVDEGPYDRKGSKNLRFTSCQYRNILVSTVSTAHTVSSEHRSKGRLNCH